MMRLWTEQLKMRLQRGLRSVDALAATAHQGRSVVVPREHVLSTFKLLGTMIPGCSMSDAVDTHVAAVLKEDKAKMTVKCNIKLGELVGVACDNAFVIPGWVLWVTTGNGRD